MDIGTVVTLIGTVGFPIVACLVMGYFIWKIYQNTTKENAKNMEEVQKRCQAREDKLYEELAQSREINAKAMMVLAQYAERLEVIQSDISEIKTDITILTAK